VTSADPRKPFVKRRDPIAEIEEEQARLLHEAAGQLFASRFGFEEAKAIEDLSEADFRVARDDLIRQLLASPGIDRCVRRQIAAQVIDEVWGKVRVIQRDMRAASRRAQRRSQLLTLMSVIYSRLDQDGELPAEQLRELHLLLSEYDRMQAANEEWILEQPLEEMLDMLRWVDREMEPWRRQLAEDAVRLRRAARLEARKLAPVAQIADHKCVRCRRKPRRVDDWCKKCAHELGVLVHGKIGEAA
jgi:hypothetical protein